MTAWRCSRCPVTQAFTCQNTAKTRVLIPPPCPAPAAAPLFLWTGYFLLGCPLSAQPEPQPRAGTTKGPAGHLVRACGVASVQTFSVQTFSVLSLSHLLSQRQLVIYEYLKASCTCAQPPAAKSPPQHGREETPVCPSDILGPAAGSWAALSPPLHPQGKAPKALISPWQGHLNSSVSPSPFSFLFYPAALLRQHRQPLLFRASPSFLCVF